MSTTAERTVNIAGQQSPVARFYVIAERNGADESLPCDTMVVARQLASCALASGLTEPRIFERVNFRSEDGNAVWDDIEVTA